jgi:hypothetical protein
MRACWTFSACSIHNIMGRRRGLLPTSAIPPFNAEQTPAAALLILRRGRLIRRYQRLSLLRVACRLRLAIRCLSHLYPPATAVIEATATHANPMVKRTAARVNHNARVSARRRCVCNGECSRPQRHPSALQRSHDRAQLQPEGGHQLRCHVATRPSGPTDAPVERR